MKRIFVTLKADILAPTAIRIERGRSVLVILDSRPKHLQIDLFYLTAVLHDHRAGFVTV